MSALLRNMKPEEVKQGPKALGTFEDKHDEEKEKESFARLMRVGKTEEAWHALMRSNIPLGMLKCPETEDHAALLSRVFVVNFFDPKAWYDRGMKRDLDELDKDEKVMKRELMAEMTKKADSIVIVHIQVMLMVFVSIHAVRFPGSPLTLNGPNGFMEWWDSVSFFHLENGDKVDLPKLSQKLVQKAALELNASGTIHRVFMWNDAPVRLSADVQATMMTSSTAHTDSSDAQHLEHKELYEVGCRALMERLTSATEDILGEENLEKEDDDEEEDTTMSEEEEEEEEEEEDTTTMSEEEAAKHAEEKEKEKKARELVKLERKLSKLQRKERKRLSDHVGVVVYESMSKSTEALSELTSEVMEFMEDRAKKAGVGGMTNGNAIEWFVRHGVWLGCVLIGSSSKKSGIRGLIRFSSYERTEVGEKLMHSGVGKGYAMYWVPVDLQDVWTRVRTDSPPLFGHHGVVHTLRAWKSEEEVAANLKKRAQLAASPAARRTVQASTTAPTTKSKIKKTSQEKSKPKPKPKPVGTKNASELFKMMFTATGATTSSTTSNNLVDVGHKRKVLEDVEEEGREVASKKFKTEETGHGDDDELDFPMTQVGSTQESIAY